MSALEPNGQAADPVERALTTFLRLTGIAVMLFGLASAYAVVTKAWALLDNPALIVPFADAIEKEARLNAFLTELSVSIPSPLDPSLPAGASSGGAGAPPISVGLAPGKTPNISYVSAWLIMILLLGLIARIGLWAVTEGGRLASTSGDQTKALVRAFRQVVSEAQREKKS